ncbi:class I SAM-dependent methyltransferase [Actinopolyspora sp. H202]|uniref:class I SAM-dependent methyltransferase n=1 Tax=Actinopolyspora sp. H202 TaxID=1500456 RepID=UPI003EE7B5AF
MLDTVGGPRLGDAFGAALRQHHQGRTAFEIVEREDGLIGVNDLAPYFAERAHWPAIDQRATPGITGRVLDLGCGAGRHAVPLTRDGFDVLGVDSSPGAVEVARDRGATATVGRADALPEGVGAFDTILRLGQNIGLLGGREQAARVLEELARVSTPDTRVLASGFDPHHTQAPEHLDYQRHNRARGRLPGQLRMRIRHARSATPFFDYLLCSVEELTGLLEDSPWRLSDVDREEAGHGYLAALVRR